ncbi:4Fe-4S binding protein [bacterium]|nr:4Fe-4S binding protein [bacterium]
MTRQMTVISGKGGTGKTSITACFGQLARHVTLADCDVDAANLHLIVPPLHERRPPETVRSGYKISVDWTNCTQCGECERVCRFDAIHLRPVDGDPNRIFPVVDPVYCEGCGFCADICPVEAIGLLENEIGTLYLSNTSLGPLVHAQLFIGESNSGKLVTRVREEAKAWAEREDRSWLIIDGSPGIGCPVIASLTGVDYALIVTEASLSGLHDFQRVAQLTRHFKIPTFTLINKADLDQELTDQIIAEAEQAGVQVLGTLPYSQLFIQAMVNCQTILEYAPDSPEAAQVRTIWNNLQSTLASRG